MARRGKTVIIGAAVLASLAAGLLVARLQQSAVPARAATISAVTATITIDPQVGETFAPAPSSTAPGISAQAAWVQYAQQNGSTETSIPANMTAQLGLLTLPVGPAGSPGTAGLIQNNGEAYKALNELVWGYSNPSPCANANPNVTLPPGSCTEWTFLDASTGKPVDQTWVPQ